MIFKPSFQKRDTANPSAKAINPSAIYTLVKIETPSTSSPTFYHTVESISGVSGFRTFNSNDYLINYIYEENEFLSTIQPLARRDQALPRMSLPQPIGYFIADDAQSTSGLLTSWANRISGTISSFIPDSGLASSVGIDAQGRKYITSPTGNHVARATISSPITERTILIAYADDYDSSQRNLLRHNSGASLTGVSLILWRGAMHSQWWNGASTFVNEAAPLAGTGAIEIYGWSYKNTGRVIDNSHCPTSRRQSSSSITLSSDSNIVIGDSSAPATGKLYALSVYSSALTPEQLSFATQKLSDDIGRTKHRARVRWGKASPASWSARDSAGIAVLNNELFIIGGFSPTLLNDVWKRTSNSETWTQVTSGASFSARNLCGCSSFNNKLWLSNGFTAGLTPVSQIWSSSDGLSWTNDVPSGSWSARAASKMIVHNGELIFCGGFTNVTGGAANDVWSSSNGSTWTQKLPSAPWLPRGSHAFLSFNGKLWVIAGGIFDTNYTNSTQIDYNDVWSSSDGVNWTREPDLPIGPCRFVSCCVYGGFMWLISAWHHQNLSLCLRSSDGKIWELIDSPFTRRHEALVSPFVNKLWIMGGVHGNDESLNREAYGDIDPKATINDQNWLELIV